MFVHLVCVSVNTTAPIPACLLRFSRSSELGVLLHFVRVQLDSASQDATYVEWFDCHSVIMPLAFVRGDSGMCSKQIHLVMVVFVLLQ